MKNIITISALFVVVAALNVGCSASASVKPTSATKLNTTTQVAYVSAPVQTVQAGK